MVAVNSYLKFGMVAVFSHFYIVICAFLYYKRPRNVKFWYPPLKLRIAICDNSNAKTCMFFIIENMLKCLSVEYLKRQEFFDISSELIIQGSINNKIYNCVQIHEYENKLVFQTFRMLVHVVQR